MNATRNPTEILVSRAIQRDRVNALFRERYNRMTRHVKCRPGGRRRNQLFDQVAAGNSCPWAQILEAIDLVIDEARTPDGRPVPEDDVLPFAQAFIDYVQGKYASREAAEFTSVKEALKLSLHSDADEIKSVSEALAEESTANLEQAADALDKDTRCNQAASKILRQRIVAARMKIERVRA